MPLSIALWSVIKQQFNKTMLYCQRCNKLNPLTAKRCGCNNKKLREPQVNDAVFLTSLDFMHGRMLQDVLTQHNIPVLVKPMVPQLAFVSAITMSAQNHFFVPFGALDKANDILKELFGNQDGEVGDEVAGNPLIAPLIM